MNETEFIQFVHTRNQIESKYKQQRQKYQQMLSQLGFFQSCCLGFTGIDSGECAWKKLAHLKPNLPDNLEANLKILQHNEYCLKLNQIVLDKNMR